MTSLSLADTRTDQRACESGLGLVRGRTFARRRRRSGFTLVEVLISVAIFGAAATILFGLMPTALKTGKMVGNHQQAASLVQHKIDQLRGVGWGRLNYTEMRSAGIVDATPGASPYSFVLVDGIEELYVEAVATISIEDFSPQVKKVTVTLTWTGSARRQGNGTLTASALIAKA